MNKPLSQQSETTLFLKASIAMYRDCLDKSLRALFKNWLLLPGLVVLIIGLLIIALFVSSLPLGIAGGFIMGISACMALSQYYSWLARSLRLEKLKFKEMFVFDYAVFSSVISVAFLIWILNMLVGFIARDIPNSATFLGMYSLALVLFFNPIPEMAYIKGERDLSAFQSSFYFVRDNWIEWFIPYVLVFGVLIGLRYDEALSILSASSPLYPFATLFSGFQRTSFSFGSEYLYFIVVFIFSHWFMMFRSELFQELDSGSRRARIYKWKNS